MSATTPFSPTRTLLQQCIGDGALADAWAKVFSNAGCPGVDGVSVETYREEALSHLASLRTEVVSGRYRPDPLLGVAIPKSNGRLRHLAIPTVRDRVLQTAVAQLLTRLLDPDFDDASFAYRCGRSVQQATARIKDCRDQGLCWVVDADIQDFFDSIDHAILLPALRQRLPDGSLDQLLAQWLGASVLESGQQRSIELGVPQGSPISPLLSNLYLHPLDRALGGAGYTLVRYADDFLVLCRSRNEAESALLLTRSTLADLRLNLNEEKSRVTHFQAGFRFLGVRFEGEKVTPVDAEAARWVLPCASSAPARPTPAQAPSAATEPATVVPVAQAVTDDEATELSDPEAVQLDDDDGLALPRSVYVTTQGVRLTRQGERMVVSRGLDAIARIPLRQLDQIVVHGNAVVSTALIRYCQDKRLGLAFADANGIDPVVLDTNAQTSMALLQAQVARNGDSVFAMRVARACIEGKLHNCRALLRRFSRRNSPDRVARAISIIGRTLQRLDRLSDLNSLRGHEGRAARAYFAALASLLPEGWGFERRNRRPPRDPVNAMLSYGYAVLSHTMQSALMPP